MPDRTPPAAADLDKRFLDVAASLAGQDQIIEDLKRQNAAMESRITFYEKMTGLNRTDIETLENDMEECDRRFAFLTQAHDAQVLFNKELFSRLDMLNVQLKDLQVCATLDHNWHFTGRSKPDVPFHHGIPQHGGPIGTAIVADMYEVPAPQREHACIDPTAGQGTGIGQ